MYCERLSLVNSIFKCLVRILIREYRVILHDGLSEKKFTSEIKKNKAS